MIYLHTLGDALIKVGDKEIRPTSPLLFAALLYLGMERGRRVPRAALQEMLFPNSDERSGSHSLRQLLYKLRQLGAPLDVDTSSVAVDVDAVRDDCAADLAAGNGHAPRLARCALGLLPDYSPKLSERYDEWLDAKRAAIAGSIRRQLVTGMKANRDAINWPAVEQFARTILELDPFNEEATLALAEASALSGAKTRALEILSRYEHETGRSDLRIASSLLRKRISESVPTVTRRMLDMPFLGREADAEAVRQQILQGRSGRATLVVIVGEPGIGKTRLLEESTALAALEGVRVQTVRCQPHYTSRPLGVFIELVPPLLAARGALGVAPHLLAHLNYLTSHSDDRTDRPTDARDDATRSGVLLAALRDLVDAVAAETPLLLAVEDAHWADPDSVRELSALVHGSSRRLTVIFTTRLLEPLRGVTTDSTFVRRLKPLSEEPMAVLATHLLPRNGSGDVKQEIAAWCIQTASGNPLFLRMLCAHYMETGQPFTVPPDLRSAITRRIEQLPHEFRRILEFSALLGRYCTVQALRSITQYGQLQLLDAVQQLEEDGYVQLRGDAIRISHDLHAESTLGLVPPVSRRLLHSAVAATLEERYDVSHDAALLWDCTEQWTLSGETEKALQFLKRCARHAAQIGRSSQAVTLLEQAKQLARNPSESADVIGEMMLATKAASEWTAVYDLAKQMSRIRPVGESVEHTDHELLAIEASWQIHYKATALITKLLACSRSSTASVEHRVDAARLLLMIAHEQGDRQLALKAYGSVKLVLDVHSTRHANRMLPLAYHGIFGEPKRALALGHKLIRELASFDSVENQLRAAMSSGTVFLFIGAFDSASQVFREFYDRSGKLDLRAWQQDFCCLACASYLMPENFEEAEAWCERAERLGGSATALGFVHAVNGVELALWRRRADLARERIAAVAKRVGESMRRKAYLIGAEIRLRQLDPVFDCGDDTLHELVALQEAAKQWTGADGVTQALVEAFRRRGRPYEAARMLEDYLSSFRREGSSAPPSLASLVKQCADDVRRQDSGMGAP